MLRSTLTICAIAIIGNGCSLYLKAIPAHRVHPSVRRPSQKELARVNLKTLQLPSDQPYYLQAGDVLAIASPALFAEKPDLPVPTILPTRVRPQLRASTGYPFVVAADGTLRLPGVQPVQVSGETIEGAEARLQQAFARQINHGAGIAADLTVEMALPRTINVLVVRQDAVRSSSAVDTSSADVAGTRFRGQVFDLHLEPQESDVLTAMVRSGGLPGLDAKDELVVLRNRFSSEHEKEALKDKLSAGSDVRRIGGANASDSEELLPLRVPRHEVPTTQNVSLQSGDIVLIENRDNQEFYVGGVFQSGRFPLPRDKPLDVLQAVAVAGGTQSGLDYGAGGRSGIASMGDATSLVPPTWVILVRQYQDRQVEFKIDLVRATWDPSHRMIVQAGDYLHLAYTPTELASNISLKQLGARLFLFLRKPL